MEGVSWMSHSVEKSPHCHWWHRIDAKVCVESLAAKLAQGKPRMSNTSQGWGLCLSALQGGPQAEVKVEGALWGVRGVSSYKVRETWRGAWGVSGKQPVQGIWLNGTNWWLQSTREGSTSCSIRDGGSLSQWPSLWHQRDWRGITWIDFMGSGLWWGSSE